MCVTCVELSLCKCCLVHALLTESETSSSSSMGDNIVRSLFSSSPTLNIFSGNEAKRPTHHRRVSSGDKLKIEISDELQQEIDSKFAKKGLIECVLTLVQVLIFVLLQRKIHELWMWIFTVDIVSLHNWFLLF